MLGRRGQFSKKKTGGGPAHSSSRIRRAALGAASRARESAQSGLPQRILPNSDRSWPS
jgi:hypothetical protein